MADSNFENENWRTRLMDALVPAAPWITAIIVLSALTAARVVTR